MEKFEIDPNEQRKLHEETLKKVDPRIAEILRKHLTYPTPLEQEEQKNVESTPEEPPKKIRDFKTHIELSQQEEKE